MTTQKLEQLSQELNDLKALKDKSIVVNGEGHYITIQITKAVQSLYNLIQMAGQTPLTMPVTQVNGVDFTDSLNTREEIKSYLVDYFNVAVENSVYFDEEVLYPLVQKDLIKYRTISYVTSIADAAYYN